MSRHNHIQTTGTEGQHHEHCESVYVVVGSVLPVHLLRRLGARLAFFKFLGVKNSWRTESYGEREREREIELDNNKNNTSKCFSKRKLNVRKIENAFLLVD